MRGRETTHSFTVQSNDDVSNKFLWFLAVLGCGCTEVTRPKCADNYRTDHAYIHTYKQTYHS